MANESPTTGNAGSLLPAISEMALIRAYRPDGSYTDFVLDALISEQHQYPSAVTDHPVETGSDVTDNIRPKPTVVTAEYIVTNTPIGPVAQLRDGSGDYVDQCLIFLMKVRDNRLPVTIATSLKSYDNMALEDLTVTRGPGGGDAMRFTCKWKQVATVTNKRVVVRTSTPSGAPSKTVSKPAGPAPQTQTGPSIGDPVQINPITNAWLDPRINGWRRSAMPISPGANVNVGGTVSSGYTWQLTNWIPDSSLAERTAFVQDVLGLTVFSSLGDTYFKPGFTSVRIDDDGTFLWNWMSSQQRSSWETYLGGRRKAAGKPPYALSNNVQFAYRVQAVPRKQIAYLGT